MPLEQLEVIPENGSVVRPSTNGSIKSPVEVMRRFIDSLPEDPPSPRSEIRQWSFWRTLRSETLATFLLTVFACTASASKPQTELKTCLAFGLTSGLLAYTLKGVAFNPCVTLARLITRKISILQGVVCCAMQCVGATIGAAIAFGVAPTQRVGVTLPPVEMHLSQVFAVELLGSLVIVLTVLTSDDDVQNGILMSSAIPTGLAYASATLFAFPYSGAGLNPAKTFGPALINNTWNRHWVYWVGPVFGGLIGGFTFDYTRSGRTSLYASLRQHKLATRCARGRCNTCGTAQHDPTLKRDNSALSSDITDFTFSSNHV